MTALFLRVLDLSAAGSIVILTVLAARLLLRRAPARYSYLLWAAAGFRLCCPLGLSSGFSLFRLPGLRPAAVSPVLGITSRMNYFPPPSGGPAGAVPSPSAPVPGWQDRAARLWLLGVALLLLYGLVSTFRLHRRLDTATRLSGNVFQSEAVRSPFLLGLVRPRIYIPYGLPPKALLCVLAHERFHLGRLDHLSRRAAFILLAVHWFNPLCWLAFFLMGRDMELSCDEGVLRRGGVSAREYSATLLAFAANRRFFADGLTAFGETSVRSRIRNVLGWKPPRRAAALSAAAISAAVLAVCVCNPAAAELQTAVPPLSGLVQHLEQPDGGQTLLVRGLDGTLTKTVLLDGDGLVLSCKPEGAAAGSFYDVLAEDRPAAQQFISAGGNLYDEWTLTYGPGGRPAQITVLRPYDGGQAHTWTYHYDAGGALSGKTLSFCAPDGSQVRQDYGPEDRLRRTVTTAPDGSRDTFDYSPDGRISHWTSES